MVTFRLCINKALKHGVHLPSHHLASINKWPSTHRCFSSVVLTFYRCLWTFWLSYNFQLLSSLFVIGTCLVCFETYLKSKTWICSLSWLGYFSYYLNSFLLSSRKSLELQICDKNRIVPDSISPRPKWNAVVLLCIVCSSGLPASERMR